MAVRADAPDTLEILDIMSGNKSSVGDKDVLLFVDQHADDDRIQNSSNNNRERNLKENILSLCSRKSPSHFYILCCNFFLPFFVIATVGFLSYITDVLGHRLAFVFPSLGNNIGCTVSVKKWSAKSG